MPLTVLWLKKDLRLLDHAALVAAVEYARDQGQALVILYVYEEDLVHQPDFSRRHLCFINDCLQELSGEVEKRGGLLILRRAGHARDVLNEIHGMIRIDRLFSHEETGNGASYRRDREVAAWCRESGVAWREIPQHGVVRCLACRDGWSGRWLKRMRKPLLPEPDSIPPPPPGIESAGIQCPESFGLTSDGEMELQPGGSRAALDLLQSFLNERGRNYTREMSSPVTGFDACSRLSPYFTHGALSIRAAYRMASERQAAVREAMKEVSKQNREDLKGWSGSLRSFLGRLRWHCHFMQKLEDEPELEFSSLLRSCDALRADSWNEAAFEAWAEGRTGYPMVDACMRSLRSTGWMNFRMRAMLMSFASYHLWLPWRPTGLLLARLFTDYEPGIHWSQVQMQSGTTGINSIRIYSPAKQVKDQDPDGEFIRRWVPELRGVPANYLSCPEAMPVLEQEMAGCRIGDTYPEPIVDHATAYREAQRKIRSVRRGSEAQAEARRIYQKHGSRRHLSESRGTRLS